MGQRRDAAVRYGEADRDHRRTANMLTKELRAAHPEVPWPLIIGMRHRLVHDYFRIDTSIVAEVVGIHLPALRHQLQAILADLSE
ncbi:MAG: DUF86 domain-containing protein [Flavobacteriales bacterium]